MLNYILQSIICSEFEKNVGRMQCKKHHDGMKMYGMEMRFKLHEASYEDEAPTLYPGAQLLLFAESNYVGIYCRESVERDDFGPWQHLSLHDSCWRDDGVNRFIRHYSDRMATLGWLGIGNHDSWYLTSEITEEEAKELRRITRETRAGNLPRGLAS